MDFEGPAVGCFASGETMSMLKVKVSMVIMPEKGKRRSLSKDMSAYLGRRLFRVCLTTFSSRQGINGMMSELPSVRRVSGRKQYIGTSTTVVWVISNVSLVERLGLTLALNP